VPDTGAADGGDESALTSIAMAPLRFGRGVAKGALGEAESVAHLIPGVDRLFGSELPGEQWAKSASDQDMGWPEYLGSWAGSALPYFAVPEIGLEAKLGDLAASAFPKTVRGSVLGRTGRAAGQMARNPVRGAAQTVGGVVGKGAEYAIPGSIAGAVSDPEHPIQGALLGAGGSMILPSTGALARTAFGKGVAGHAGAHAAGYKAAGLGHAAFGGLGYFLYPIFVYGPGGKAVKSGAHWIADRYGRVIGALPAAPTGAAGGGALSSFFAPYPAPYTPEEAPYQRETTPNAQAVEPRPAQD
ncbi:MAG TPA: hypothetical protein VF778_04345, partial [Xanthobacteraceae bacterium]